MISVFDCNLDCQKLLHINTVFYYYYYYCFPNDKIGHCGYLHSRPKAVDCVTHGHSWWELQTCIANGKLVSH